MRVFLLLMMRKGMHWIVPTYMYIYTNEKKVKKIFWLTWVKMQEHLYNQPLPLRIHIQSHPSSHLKRGAASTGLVESLFLPYVITVAWIWRRSRTSGRRRFCCPLRWGLSWRTRWAWRRFSTGSTLAQNSFWWESWRSFRWDSLTSFFRKSWGLFFRKSSRPFFRSSIVSLFWMPSS